MMNDLACICLHDYSHYNVHMLAALWGKPEQKFIIKKGGRVSDFDILATRLHKVMM